jgi:hypothetical protein
MYLQPINSKSFRENDAVLTTNNPIKSRTIFFPFGAIFTEKIVARFYSAVQTPPWDTTGHAELGQNSIFVTLNNDL